MFGFNIFEILVILIVAIIFLGPDKLPQLIIDVVKFFKMIKRSINEAKEGFDKELQLSELKKEALEYKSRFEEGVNKHIKEFNLKDVDSDVNKMFEEFNEPKMLESKTTQSPFTSSQSNSSPSSQIKVKSVSFKQKKVANKSTTDKKPTKKTTNAKTGTKSTSTKTTSAKTASKVTKTTKIVE